MKHLQALDDGGVQRRAARALENAAVRQPRVRQRLLRAQALRRVPAPTGKRHLAQTELTARVGYLDEQQALKKAAMRPPGVLQRLLPEALSSDLCRKGKRHLVRTKLALPIWCIHLSDKVQNIR